MDYKTRLAKLQTTIHKAGCNALLIEDAIDLFYMTGLELSAGKLLVHSNGAELLVDSRYFEACKKRSPFPVTLLEKGILESLLTAPDFLHIQKLGFNSEKTSYKHYESLLKIITSQSKEGRYLELIPLDSPLQIQRSIKDPEEIQALREAAALGSEGYNLLCGLLKEGISEAECAMELEIFWKQKGSKGVAFDPIIAFGANSSMPHYRAGNEILKKGDIVLIDIGVNFKHYHSDMTRIVFFGHPNPRLVEIHKIVQEAQYAALELCSPGTTLGELDKAARDIIANYGYANNFTHSLGHGVGLDIHEYPTIRNVPPFGEIPLVNGMVITIEPGIYLPEIGGVRIEDTVVITDSSHENLSKPSKELYFINGRR
jgi:Xaa-Pro aminopeptidase